MSLKKQNSNITKAKKSDLRKLLKADDSRGLVRYVSKLSARSIYTTQAEAGELQVAIDYMRHRFKTATGEDKVYVERKGKELAAQLESLAPFATIHELQEADEDDLIADLTVLILDMDESFNVGKSLSVGQVEHLAITIPTRYAALTLEDVAVCFHRAKCGDYGTVYDRLDLNVIHGWLHKYQDERKELMQHAQQNRHLGSKEGMSYDPTDRASTVRVSKDRGVDTDDETRYQAFKSELKLKEQYAKERIERKLKKSK
jgi:hypothetical protein